MGPAKNALNVEKHGLSFAETAELFRSGEDYLVIFDDTHSDVEERFIAIGPIKRGLVVVVHTEQDDDSIRIISARFATKRERELFSSKPDESP